MLLDASVSYEVYAEVLGVPLASCATEAEAMEVVRDVIDVYPDVFYQVCINGKHVRFVNNFSHLFGTRNK